MTEANRNMSHVNQSETIVTDSIERYGASINAGERRRHVCMECQTYYNLFLYQLWSWALKLRSELHDFVGAGIEFQRDAPENEKLV